MHLLSLLLTHLVRPLFQAFYSLHDLLLVEFLLFAEIVLKLILVFHHSLLTFLKLLIDSYLQLLHVEIQFFSLNLNILHILNENLLIRSKLISHLILKVKKHLILLISQLGLLLIIQWTKKSFALFKYLIYKSLLTLGCLNLTKHRPHSVLTILNLADLVLHSLQLSLNVLKQSLINLNWCAIFIRSIGRKSVKILFLKRNARALRIRMISCRFNIFRVFLSLYHLLHDLLRQRVSRYLLLLLSLSDLR